MQFFEKFSKKNFGVLGQNRENFERKFLGRQASDRKTADIVGKRSTAGSRRYGLFGTRPLGGATIRVRFLNFLGQYIANRESQQPKKIPEMHTV